LTKRELPGAARAVAQVVRLINDDIEVMRAGGRHIPATRRGEIHARTDSGRLSADMNDTFSCTAGGAWTTSAPDARRCASIKPATALASRGVIVPSATAASTAPIARAASSALATAGISKATARSLRGGKSRSRHSRSAVTSPASASSTALRVSASASPSQQRFGGDSRPIPRALRPPGRIAARARCERPPALFPTCFFTVHIRRRSPLAAPRMLQMIAQFI
jgi:hypothetical protein